MSITEPQNAHCGACASATYATAAAHSRQRRIVARAAPVATAWAPASTAKAQMQQRRSASSTGVPHRLQPASPLTTRSPAR